jgi:hypothetical protein
VERDSTFGRNAQAAAPGTAKESVGQKGAGHEPRFSSEGQGIAFREAVERDFHAALQLLAERARYLTAASGALIALAEEGQVICRGSAGPAAPRAGTRLQLEDGLAGESLRQRQLLICDDAESDSRVNGESCRALGIRSVMAMPLLRNQGAAGVFELLADRTQAFEEREAAILRRLSELALTALEHAEADMQVVKETAMNEEQLRAAGTGLASAGGNLPSGSTVPSTGAAAGASVDKFAGGQPAESKPGGAGQCAACGFPVSYGRTLCVDCEAAQARQGSGASNAVGAESQMAVSIREESWFERHMYTIATIVMAALTVLALWLKFG